MKDTVVLYPCPGRGHLVAMVELANHLLNQNPSFSITIIVTSTPPFQVSISDVAELRTNSSITFHHVPPITLTKTYSFPAHLPNLFYDLAESSNPNLHEALTNISKTSIVKALVIDFFNTTIHKNTTSSLKDLVDFHIDVPGLPPVPSSAMPIGLMDRTTELYDCFIKTSTYLAKCDGVIVNSFEFLEKKALDAIRKGDCTLAGEKPPPVYCIGPVLENAKDDEHDYIIKWLDSQPSQSVLFLCFGSMGVFSSKQLSEMAVALETSNIRFLWVALWVAESEKDGLVSASELEQRVAELFQSEKGKEVRERVMVMRDEAAVAIKDGGSSDIALKKLIESLERVGRF
ncbi:hypothetical protein ACFE04_009304 [Oxalis oulophora]